MATKAQIIKSMRDHGGGFVQALATAYERADPDNSKRIVSAFADYITTYAQWADRDAMLAAVNDGPQGAGKVAAL
jgi:hypothetical protein